MPSYAEFIHRVLVVLFVPDFFPNAAGSLVLGKLTPLHNKQGGGGLKIQKLEFRGPIFADFWPFGPSF